MSRWTMPLPINSAGAGSGVKVAISETCPVGAHTTYSAVLGGTTPIAGNDFSEATPQPSTATEARISATPTATRVPNASSSQAVLIHGDGDGYVYSACTSTLRRRPLHHR